MAGNVKLEDLLVEETWLEAVAGEFEKPYAKNLCQFVGREICSGAHAIYPPSHMIFNALNSTPFPKVKAVILGQVTDSFLSLKFCSIKIISHACFLLNYSQESFPCLAVIGLVI